MQKSKDRGHEDESGDGGESKATDDGAAEGRVLLATIAYTERHGNHADDHGEGRHADGTEARGAGFYGSKESVSGR